MIKRIFLSWLSVAVIASRIHAAGMGVSLDYSGSMGSVLDRDYTDTVLDDSQESNLPLYDRADMNVFTVGGGFVVDTAYDNRSVFNYRLILGLYYMRLTAESDHLGSTLYQGYGTSQQHTVGLSFLHSDTVRLWIGPQIAYSYNTVYTADDVDKRTLVLLFFSIGPVIGCDFALTQRIILGFTCGYRYTFIRGSDDFMGLFEDKSFEGYAHVGLLQVSILFRFGLQETAGE